MNKVKGQIMTGNTQSGLTCPENEGSGQTFRNLPAVLKYLEDQGFRITRASLYRHHKEGKLLPELDGTYSQRIVDRYAKSFVKLTATGKRLRETSDNLQRRKLEEELKNLRLKNKRDEFNYEKDRGSYVPKNEMEMQLAMRAGIFLAGLKHWIMTQAAIWIASTGGDTKKTGELIRLMSDDLDSHINLYASNQMYEVMIDAEEETPNIPDNDEIEETQASGPDA